MIFVMVLIPAPSRDLRGVSIADLIASVFFASRTENRRDARALVFDEGRQTPQLTDPRPRGAQDAGGVRRLGQRRARRFASNEVLLSDCLICGFASCRVLERV
jgi:hypothetical protein